MATIPTGLLRDDTETETGILSTLVGKFRLFFGERRATVAERVNQADLDFYDHFYG